MMSVSQLAAALGVSPRRARELCAAGLPGVERVGPRLWVVVDEEDALRCGLSRCTKRGPKPRRKH